MPRGVNTAYVDERMAALAASLQSQISSVATASHSESQTIYQTVGMVARVENLDDVNINDSDITNWRITGGTITGVGR